MTATPSRASILAATVSNALGLIPQTTTKPILVRMSLINDFRRHRSALTGRRWSRCIPAHSDPNEGRSRCVIPMRSIVAIRAVGHDIAGLHSKPWTLFTGPDAPKLDFVIGLCDTLDRRTYPDFGDKAITASWSMPDPAKFTGQGVERETMLNELYAGLYRRITLSRIYPFPSSIAWRCASASMKSARDRLAL